MTADITKDIFSPRDGVTAINRDGGFATFMISSA
jgi:hypothetical protein